MGRPRKSAFEIFVYNFWFLPFSRPQSTYFQSLRWHKFRYEKIMNSKIVLHQYPENRHLRFWHFLELGHRLLVLEWKMSLFQLRGRVSPYNVSSFRDINSSGIYAKLFKWKLKNLFFILSVKENDRHLIKWA